MRSGNAPRPKLASMSIAELQRLADEELMPQIAAKNADAFEVFYDRHGRGLLARLPDRRQPAGGRGRRPGGSDLDLAQRRALRSDARQPRTWTLGVVRNRAIDMLRRDASRIPKLAFDPQELLDQSRPRID